MGFYSTARNSPQAGTATAGLRDLMRINESKRQFDINDERVIDELIARKQEEARLKTLSQSLLALPKFDQENATAWAISNNVSASELTALEPVMKQREQQTEFVDIDTPTERGQINKATGQKFTTQKKKKVVTKNEGGFTTQYDPDTNQVLNRYENKETPRKVVNKEDKYFIWQEDPTTGQVLNRVRKPEVEGAGDSKKSVTKADKVEDWYIKLGSEMDKAWYGDNEVRTETQRQNRDRAMLRAEDRVAEMSAGLGISKEAAVPYAMRQIRQEKVWAVNAERSLPAVSRNMLTGGSEGDTVQEIKDLRRTGTPNYIIGDALVQKGWTDEEISELMINSSQLTTAKAAGFNAEKLANTRLSEGQSVQDKQGVLWTRKGKYLISEDGRRVKI